MFSWSDMVWVEESSESLRDASGCGHRCEQTSQGSPASADELLLDNHQHRTLLPWASASCESCSFGRE